MANPISSSGFTKCAVCGVHIKATEPCPFCAASDAGKRPGRGGLITAGLLSVGLATAACDDDDTDPSPDQEDAQARDGQTADMAPDMAPDMPIAPLYGIPPNDAGVPPPDMSAPQPDMTVMPLYGGPPDASVQDMAPPPDMAAPAPDAGILPPYGIPPDQDMAVPAPDEGMAVPLYGIPPGEGE